MSLDFDVKELSNIKFSINDLLNYYEEIKNNYQHLKWNPDGYDQKNHIVKNLYGWAIQSNLKDVSKISPLYDIKHDEEIIGTFDNPTELVFGFAKVIIDAIPNIRQTVISVHPSGTVIQQHTDNTDFVKIHIPIESNENSYFVFGDKKYNLKVGKAYLINTARLHGTVNEGDSERAHFIFKIPRSSIETILKNDWIFDANALNFTVLELSNFQFNFLELQEYYTDIKNNFNYLKWTMPEIENTVLGGLYGYAILTNKKNIEEPIDPPTTRKDKPRYEPFLTPTKMLKGFAKKIYDTIPYLEELVISGHPPNTGIPPHIDKDEHIRIHLPIFTTDKSFFILDDTKYVLNARKVYAVNTKIIHSTLNEGLEDRIHLHFKIPYGKFFQFFNTNISL